MSKRREKKREREKERKKKKGKEGGKKRRQGRLWIVCRSAVRHSTTHTLAASRPSIAARQVLINFRVYTRSSVQKICLPDLRCFPSRFRTSFSSFPRLLRPRRLRAATRSTPNVRRYGLPIVHARAASLSFLAPWKEDRGERS